MRAKYYSTTGGTEFIIKFCSQLEIAAIAKLSYGRFEHRAATAVTVQLLIQLLCSLVILTCAAFSALAGTKRERKGACSTQQIPVASLLLYAF